MVHGDGLLIWRWEGDPRAKGWESTISRMKRCPCFTFSLSAIFGLVSSRNRRRIARAVPSMGSATRGPSRRDGRRGGIDSRGSRGLRASRGFRERSCGLHGLRARKSCRALKVWEWGRGLDAVVEVGPYSRSERARPRVSLGNLPRLPVRKRRGQGPLWAAVL